MKHHNRGLTSAVEVLGLGPVHRACVTYSLTRVILLPSTVLVTEAQLLSLPPSLSNTVSDHFFPSFDVITGMGAE